MFYPKKIPREKNTTIQKFFKGDIFSRNVGNKRSRKPDVEEPRRTFFSPDYTRCQVARPSRQPRRLFYFFPHCSFSIPPTPDLYSEFFHFFLSSFLPLFPYLSSSPRVMHDTRDKNNRDYFGGSLRFNLRLEEERSNIMYHD